MRQPKLQHFHISAEGARDLRLACMWIAALLLVGGAANLAAILFQAGRW